MWVAELNAACDVFGTRSQANGKVSDQEHDF